MRLDKYLKVSRLIKRRTLAKEICDSGRVSINGRSAKPGTEVKTGDKLTIGFGNRTLSVEVLATPPTARADEAEQLYRVLAENKQKLPL